MAFLLEEEDQSVVEAALSFVDEFTGDASDISTLSTASTAALTLPVTENDMARREKLNERKKMLRAAGVYGNSNHVRNNRRIEIAYLREQLEKLQIDLEMLKKQKGEDTRRTPKPSRRQKAATQQSTADAIVAMNTPTMTTVWENIADSQRRRRKKAECENIRLKMVIEHQQKVADNLRNLIQKRASQLGAECSFFTDVNCGSQHVLNLHGDVGEFQGLFRHLDNAYQELDAVFAANGLNDMVVTRSDVQVRDGAGGKYVELFFNKVLPFKLQDATEATWEHFRGSEKHMGNGSVYEKKAQGVKFPYTIVEDFTKEMHSNSSRADARMKQVVRRHVEPNRDVVIAVVSVNPAEVKNRMLAGLRYQVRSYAVTKRSPASTPEREVSQLQCCSLISFDEATEAKLGSDAIRALTNFLIVSLAAKMQGHQDCIENALMDHALQSEPHTTSQRVIMASSLDEADDRAFQAALSFVDECVLDEDEVEDAAALRATTLLQREDEWAAMSSGQRPTVDITGSETFFGALGSYEMTSSASSIPSNARGMAVVNRQKLRRRTELNERKKLLRKAGIYGDANWMSKDSRLEIAYLQERLEKLQLDLQVLQTRKNRQPATSVVQLRTDAMDSALQIPSVWEEISCRQQRRLKEAERVNARLKLAVQRQQKVSNCMTNVVRKRARHLVRNSCPSHFDFSSQHIVRALSLRSGGAGDFPLLFRHLDTAYQEVDAVFSSNGLANMVLTPSDVHIREGVNGKYLEAFSNKVLPFGLRASTEATWDHFKGSEKHLGNGNIYEKTAKNPDDPYTVIEEFTKEMHSKNARADIKVQQLVRRYMELDRDIVIWVAIAEPAEIKHKKLRGLTYHLRGYAMTKRSPASTPGHEMSQLQCVSLISLEPEAEAMYGAETVRAVTNFLIVTAAQKMQAHQDRIENALVDKQLRRRGIATFNTN
ncbi:M96 mating-specific protein family [Phytophthora palmivora]|uniref:M96 mating-specific protein family n=1 Tax=Phytophthora palmivora TaxID=4796 RepID=A0A2P4WX92_9STRA|nr:M96 mating-specific protein family [Phytophthora palmivora]